MFSREQFLEKYLKVPVIEVENDVAKNPLVSVCVQTYNQQDFISQCLDGILEQKTNFDFEILVGEDESSDNTRAVCLDYAARYPDRLRLFLHSRENNIEVYGKPTSHFNFKYNMYSARGKYIAICEGDDFWNNPLKLQNQVNFLEQNKEYGLVYTDVNLLTGNENKKIEGDDRLKNFEKRYDRIKERQRTGHVFWDLLEKNSVNTLTVCTSRDLIIDYINRFSKELFAYDHRLWLHVATYRKIKFIDEKWGTYRILNQGISNSSGFFNKRTPLAKQSALINYLSETNFNYKKIDKVIFPKIVYGILKNKDINKEEKTPITSILKSHPKLLLIIVIWRYKRLVSKLKKILFNG